MIFGETYPLYLNRLLKKGRTEKELKQVISQRAGVFLFSSLTRIFA